MKKLLSIFVFALFSLVLIHSASAASWTFNQLTNTTGVESNADIVTDSNDVTHRVYERDGQIYYSNSEDNTTESYVGDGTNPAIAVGPDNKPQIVYISGSTGWYVKQDGNSWVGNSFSGANWIDIAVDSTNKAHIVYQGNTDSDGYAEIVYSVPTSPETMSNTILADGAYDSSSRSGNYYSNPSIFIDKNDNMYIAFTTSNWGGSASYSNKAMYVYSTRTGFSQSGPSADWNAGIESYKNNMGLDANGNLHLIYNYQGSMVDAVLTSSGWTQNALSISDKFGVSTKDDRLGLVYINDGSINYMEYASSWSAPEFVDSGNNPVVALGSVTITYIKNSDLYEAYRNRKSHHHNELPVMEITPSIVTGTVTYNGTAVEGAKVVIVCNNVSSTVYSNLFGDYYTTFTSDNCKFGDSVDVSASKDSLNGHNTGNMCDGKECEIPVGLVDVDVQVPEFGVIGATVVLLAGIGIVFYRRR